MKTQPLCSSLAALLLLISSEAVQAQFEYRVDDGKVTITHYTGPGGAVAIPDTIQGMPVTSIGDLAFSGCTSLTSVTIPDSVSSIGESAFIGCTSLTGITIPDSVTRIRWRAFEGCTSLTNITLPDQLTGISAGLFSGCSSLRSVAIGKNVTTFENFFYDWRDNYGGAGTFYGCDSLVELTVDALNPTYSSQDGVLFDKSQTTLLSYPRGRAGSYVIPDTVTSIDVYAFINCTSLTNITIPDSVTNIDTGAFDGCTSLTSITIPDSVSSIGTFFCCTSLTSVTIPASVTDIGQWAFFDCTSLTSVYFEGASPRLGSGVFNGADNATLYYLPGAFGWGSIFGGRPTALWLPQIECSDARFAIPEGQFRFTISWAGERVVVVEACMDLANPSWSVVGSVTLANGSGAFSDPDWANYPGRFYRLRWQ